MANRQAQRASGPAPRRWSATGAEVRPAIDPVAELDPAAAPQRRHIRPSLLLAAIGVVLVIALVLFVLGARA